MKERYAIEIHRRLQQDGVDVNAGVVHTSEGNVCAERDVGSPASFLVDNDRPALLRTRIHTNPEFGYRAPLASASGIECPEQPVGGLTCGVDEATVVHVQAKRLLEQSVPRQRAVYHYGPGALGFDRSDVRLARRQIAK